MIKKVDHIVITTANIEECIEFYKKLGFTVHDDFGRYELFAGDFKINVHIKGHELLPHAKNVKIGSGDLCFEISDDINAFKDSLVAKNLEIEEGIVERHGVKGVMQSIYLRDPDGNLIELSKYK
ncbi:MAG: VOC family protein [Clostridiales bacterium]